MDGWMEGWLEGVGKEQRQLDGWVTHMTSLNGADDEAPVPRERYCPLCVSGRLAWPRLGLEEDTSGFTAGSPQHFLSSPWSHLPFPLGRVSGPGVGVASAFLPLLSSLQKDLGGHCAPSWRRDSEAPLCLVTC